jgi:dimethylamine/trimethylamine dehydrogenase
MMVDQVHEHGALAGVELWHGGAGSKNFYSRETPLGHSSLPAGIWDPVQTKAMDKRDIRNVKQWHREAAMRAKRAGFDIIYVYAAHWFLLSQFVMPSNRRTDEYGGSLENRARLLKELIIETKEAVGDTCAVAVRISASTGGPDHDQDTAEPREMIELLGELPDLWDMTVRDYSFEMGTSRFVQEAALEDTVSWVKSVTTKPVVSVGRFTSPDTMLRLVRQGVVDLVGAARPSIADPFIPKKIDEGRDDEIRECIGCNICYTGDQTGTPIRCTQNPTMGEEWRKGWHPEHIPAKGSDSSVLIVGGGPAGLEAAVALGKRGYAIRQWDRVRDWRLNQISKLDNVEYYLESVVDREQILEFAADRVVVATGATWRRDGIGRSHDNEIPGWQTPSVMTPDDVLGGKVPDGPVVVYDDDHYYIGGVIAEKLRGHGCVAMVWRSRWSHLQMRCRPGQSTPRNRSASRGASSTSGSTSRQAHHSRKYSQAV